MEFRVGHGYDVHRLVEGRPLILGGVTIPFERGLDGHSDADVLVHAVMDSLLGAIGQEDIGCHFPDNDDKYKNISSLILLSEVKIILSQNCWKVGNIDCTIIAQRPKLSPYIQLMQDKIASCLEIDTNKVNIKATTEERLGFTGKELGIAAHSVSLVCKE